MNKEKWENKEVFFMVVKSPSSEQTAYKTLHQKSIKRASLFSLKASMSVEAAVVLPLFLFFFINLASSIEMIRLHGNISIALWDTGNHMSYYGAFLTDAMSELAAGEDEESAGNGEAEDNKEIGAMIIEEIGDLAVSYAFVKNRLVNYLGSEYLATSPMVGGADGMNFLESEIFTDNDEIQIAVTYPVTTPINMGGIISFRMANKYYGHLWNGYDVSKANESEKKDKLVFVTENSEVYHNRTSCTYLKLSIRACNISDLKNERNSDGGTYKRCLICARGTKPQTIYLCDEGEKYHYNRECMSLRRSFKAVNLSSVQETHRPCSRCGK